MGHRTYKQAVRRFRAGAIPKQGEWWVNLNHKSLREGFVYVVKATTLRHVSAVCLITKERRVLPTPLFLGGKYGRVPPKWKDQAAAEAQQKFKQTEKRRHECDRNRIK